MKSTKPLLLLFAYVAVSLALGLSVIFASLTEMQKLGMHSPWVEILALTLGMAAWFIFRKRLFSIVGLRKFIDDKRKNSP
jgi:hypothetical protein